MEEQARGKGDAVLGWTPVLAEDALTDGRPVRVEVDGEDVLVARDSERLFAIGNRCTHQGAPLHRGPVRFSGSLTTVQCPLHGSMFGLVDGKVLRGPATAPVPAYDARVNEAMVEIRRRD
jgi:nitrite reductase/ring-hydroxylating ferredoxin subunit